MAYKNNVYVSMDADSDLRYYNLMKAWKQSDHSSFYFIDAHDINEIYDKSEESIKSGLQKRFRNSKVFILLVGDSTMYLYKYVRWEIEQAIKRELPIIVVNLNGTRTRDDVKCPPIIKNELALHISFNSKILEYALKNWPSLHESKVKEKDKSSYHYKQETYTKLGI
ncbi:TIR domain-containing protein [Aquirufa sp. OSTEICH-129A]